MNVNKAIKSLQKAFPDISGIKAGNEWTGDPEDDTSIFLGDAGEGGEIDGMPAADYYECTGSYEDFGIHKTLVVALAELGYYAEWYDSGTLFAYPI